MKIKTQINLVLIAAAVVLTFNCKQLRRNSEVAENGGINTDPVNVPQQKVIDKAILLGDWVRTDAEYRIQILELQDGGIMKAGYFNPKSINIDKATWSFEGGLLKIYIELRDENYPGSNYNLTYIPGRDLLAGKYFQAVEGTTYDVGFVKKK